MELISLVPLCEIIRDLIRTNENIVTLVNKKQIVDNEVMNYNPNNTPWIGVYPGSTAASLEPETLGLNSYVNIGSIDIYIQVASTQGKGKNAAIKLETIVKHVVSILTSNVKLKGNVRRIIDITAENRYLTNDADLKTYYPETKLSVSFEVKTT